MIISEKEIKNLRIIGCDLWVMWLMFDHLSFTTNHFNYFDENDWKRWEFWNMFLSLSRRVKIPSFRRISRSTLNFAASPSLNIHSGKQTPLFCIISLWLFPSYYSQIRDANIMNKLMYLFNHSWYKWNLNWSNLTQIKIGSF